MGHFNKAQDIEIRFLTTPLCDWCGLRPATERHHCLINRNRHKPELDDERNIGNVCHDCHAQWIGTGGREVREKWWGIQCAKYGMGNMRVWYNALRLRVKERFE